MTKKAPGVGFVFRQAGEVGPDDTADGKSLSAADLRMEVYIKESTSIAKCKVAEGGTIEIMNVTGGVTLLTAAGGTRAEGIVLPRASTYAMYFWFVEERFRVQVVSR